MSLIRFIADPMVLEQDEDLLWDRWREVCQQGISSYQDSEIRDLYANFVLMLADAELKFAHFDGQKEAKKLEKEIEEIRLLNTKYNNDKAMNARIAETKADARYMDVANKAKEYELNRALWKGRVAACTKVTECLSREISYRIKN